MDVLLDDYGQAVVLIVFGAGIITLMGRLLGYIVSEQTFMKDMSAVRGLESKVKTEGYSNIDFFTAVDSLWDQW